MKPFISYYLSLALLTIVAFSCKRFAEDPEKKIFRYNESAGITSLDPAFAKDQANIWAVNQLFNGLVQLSSDLHIQPCIAKSWRISDDGLTYTFTLRGDVFFHDNPCFPDGEGRRLIASDFVFSLRRLADPQMASPGAWILNDVAEADGHKQVSCPDDSTLIIRLKRAFPPFLGLLTTQYASV
ncbi:MAG: ABC transporter substrate-binding protein, partial [Bacteroidetes bacterium]|nr:ABC transporter substrate-binding protein [Bacteroidota bacterium]